VSGPHSAPTGPLVPSPRGVSRHLGIEIGEGEEGDALEAFHNEDIAQRPL
jgi:hypothetical protein